MTQKTILFTCCGGAGGWAILRSLENNPNFRLIGVDGEHLTAGLYQPGLDGRYLVPLGNEPGYIDAILDIAGKERADVVWPCFDEEVIAISKNQARFKEKGIIPMVPPIETVHLTTDKLAMVRKLETVGVPVPVSWGLDEEGPNDVYPVIVRPKTARGGKGVHFFDTPEQVAAFKATLPGNPAAWFVQEQIQAPMGNMHLAAAIFDHDQNRLAFFMSRSIRTAYSWGGPSLGGIAVKNDRLKEVGIKSFAAAGNWYGPVNAEFLYDPKREDFVFIEINPRYWGYSYLATAAGINFPEITARLAFGEAIEPQEDFSTEVITLTSREQVAVPLDHVPGDIPAAGHEN